MFWQTSKSIFKDQARGKEEAQDVLDLAAEVKEEEDEEEKKEHPSYISNYNVTL